jgi:8-oxo-dGTP pyrophosphatase MutT (NUDIX family)
MKPARPAIDETRNPWTVLASRVAYANPWVTVHHDDVLDPNGRPGVYGVVRPRNWALGVLPLFDDGTTVLVGQYRYALGRYSWEMPEGGGAKDVDPLDGIVRELREETGLQAGAWFELSRMTLSNSITDELAIHWLAWDLTEGAAEPESTEELASWRLPFAELVDLVLDGTVHDSMTVAAVLATEVRRRRGELPDGARQRLG